MRILRYLTILMQILHGDIDDIGDTANFATFANTFLSIGGIFAVFYEPTTF